ncbi:MAG: glutaredoxin family protein [Deltaproteobacteria bacterium]|jgi:glutaredoxin|nr:glutaredoxin family protein [Deltaproteobacteria bacterium]
MKKIFTGSSILVALLVLITACSSTPDFGEPYGELPASCQIEVFISASCQYCHKLQEFLKAKNIPFIKRDVVHDYWARQDYYALKGSGVPLTKIGDKLVKGNRPEEVEAAFREYCGIK